MFGADQTQRALNGLPRSLLETVAELRARAWGQHSLGVETQLWLDDWDAVAQHHVVLRGGHIAAAFRFTVHENLDSLPHRQTYGSLVEELPVPIAWSSRLVVDPKFRGCGLSRPLDHLAANEPFNHGAKSIVTTGGSVAENQFRHGVMIRQGWTLLGKAIGTIDLPLPDNAPPSVYARVWNQQP